MRGQDFCFCRFSQVFSVFFRFSVVFWGLLLERRGRNRGPKEGPGVLFRDFLGRGAGRGQEGSCPWGEGEGVREGRGSGVLISKHLQEQNITTSSGLNTSQITNLNACYRHATNQQNVCQDMPGVSTTGKFHMSTHRCAAHRSQRASPSPQTPESDQHGHERVALWDVLGLLHLIFPQICGWTPSETSHKRESGLHPLPQKAVKHRISGRSDRTPRPRQFVSGGL